MNFQLALTRKHNTIIDPATKAPLVDFNFVSVTPDESIEFTPGGVADALLHPEESLMAAVLANPLPGNPDYPQDGWGEWTPVVIRDAYSFAPAPVLKVYESTPVIQSLRHALSTAPLLFGTDEWSAFRVLVDWLFSGEPGTRTFMPNGTFKVTYNTKWGDTTQPPFTFRVHENWGAGPLVQVPLKLPKVSLSARAFNLPANLENSYMVAFNQLFEILLDRPVWENNFFEPQAWSEYWLHDVWRLAALAQGSAQRALVEEAYKKFMNTFGARLTALGMVTQRAPLDVSMPPRARSFQPQHQAAQTRPQAAQAPQAPASEKAAELPVAAND